MEGRPCDGNRPPLIGSGMGDLASLPDSFHAPSAQSSAAPWETLSPFRGISADTCYQVYKAHDKFDRAQKRAASGSFLVELASLPHLIRVVGRAGPVRLCAEAG